MIRSFGRTPTSVGWSRTKVGCTRSCSHSSSKQRARSSPRHDLSAAPVTPAPSASSLASAKASAADAGSEPPSRCEGGRGEGRSAPTRPCRFGSAPRRGGAIAHLAQRVEVEGRDFLLDQVGHRDAAPRARELDGRALQRMSKG
eukprot:scaffold56312_cov29-Tisochrysis_lutea.AAC.3